MVLVAKPAKLLLLLSPESEGRAGSVALRGIDGTGPGRLPCLVPGASARNGGMLTIAGREEGIARQCQCFGSGCTWQKVHEMWGQNQDKEIAGVAANSVQRCQCEEKIEKSTDDRHER